MSKCNKELIKDSALRYLDFSPTEEQMALIHALSAFISSPIPNEVFVLNGFAGTGKTSVMAAIIKALKELKQKTVVLAPTGRAAKVASYFSGARTSTIHKRLFRGNSADPSNTTFFPAENNDSNTLFIVDEASLITDGQSLSSSLLMQLIRHVYNGRGCKMVLLGDLAQLPPVGQSASMAMDPERLRQLGLIPIQFSLIQPVRQLAHSGILYNATMARQFLFSDRELENYIIYSSGFPDVEVVDPSEMLDSLSSSYSRVGKDETIVITRSNFRANKINDTIRRYLMDAEGPLTNGERLVISKNDYFWSKENKLPSFIANGDIAEISSLGRMEKKYGRWFANVELRIPGIENPVSAMLLLRSLVAEGPAVSREEMERFYNRILAETDGELSEKIKTATESPYYNALQAKYGYCVTCHKAQGGQWKHVYIDMGGISQDVSKTDLFRWLYTALTRAVEKIYFVNPPFEIE